MLLPAQHAAAERHAVVLVARLGRDEPAPAAEVDERGTVRLAALARRVEGEMQHAARNLDRREGTRVHFAEHGRAQPVRLEPLSFDADLRAHGRTRGMRAEV